MLQNLKRPIKSILLFMIIAISGIILINVVLSRYLTSNLGGWIQTVVPSTTSLTSSHCKVNILTNSVEINDLIVNTSKATANWRTNAVISSVLLKGIDLWTYWLEERIAIDRMVIKKSKVIYTSEAYKEKNEKKSMQKKAMIPIHIKKVIVENADFSAICNQNTKYVFKGLNVSLIDIIFDKDTNAASIPFNFTIHHFQTAQISMPINRYDFLDIKSIDFAEKTLSIKEVHIKTKYNKKELSKIIRQERDHLDITIPEIKIWNPSIDYHTSLLKLTADSSLIKSPNAEFYRDKLVQDDNSYKKMYGTLLSELPFELNLGRLKIHNGYISYKEKIEASIAPEQIYFDAVQVSIPEFSNQSDFIEAAIASTIMGEAELNLRWKLPVQESSGYFLQQGSVSNFKAATLNPFLKSNVRSEAKGFIQELYFTTSGNQEKAVGDMKMKYQNFEFKVLRKDRLGVNKLLTKIGNLLVNSGDQTDKNGYRYGEIEVERDHTKSVFNYLWLQVRDGIISTTTGDGIENKSN